MSDRPERSKDVMRVRIRSTGPEAWRLIVEDVDGDKYLPVMWGNDPTDMMTLVDYNGVLALECRLMIDEIDVEADVAVARLVMIPGGETRYIAFDPKRWQKETSGDQAASDVAADGAS